MNKFLFSIALILQIVLSSCTENTADNTAETTNQAAVNSVSQKLADSLIIEPEENAGDLSDLFTYHNKLLVNGHVEINVLGIGTTSVGNYLILKSDKKRGSYVSITGDKQGRIVNSIATDMDADHQIEVILFIRDEKTSWGKLLIHEIDSLQNHTRITLPDLSSDLAEGYKGQDTFYVEKNKIIREFPVFPNSSSGTQTASARRHIQYVLKNNTLLSSGHQTKQ